MKGDTESANGPDLIALAPDRPAPNLTTAIRNGRVPAPTCSGPKVHGRLHLPRRPRPVCSAQRWGAATCGSVAVEELSRLPKIRRRETLCEPIAGRRQDFAACLTSALTAVQASQARRGSQFEHAGTEIARDVQSA